MLPPGITAERVPTSRLTVNVLEVAGRPAVPTTGNTPVLFVHGNVSSSLFWQPMMLALPEPYRPLAIDLRGFGDTDDEPVNATRGLRDFSDDLAAAAPVRPDAADDARRGGLQAAPGRAAASPRRRHRRRQPADRPTS